MNLLLAYRLLRVITHVLIGMLTCAVRFPWLDLAARNARIRRWSGQLMAICGVHVEQIDNGSPALEHAMIVANHVSWLDIFVINSLHPCRFVAKSEIRAWPMLGWLAEKAGTVFIARGNRRDLRHVFKGLVASLQAGERVGFFPEGTTSEQGKLLPFHSNLFEAAVDAGVAVQAFALAYVDADGARHPSVDFIGDMTFAHSMVVILSGRPIRAQLTCLPALPALGAHRRELAQASHELVAGALGHAR